MSVQVALTAKSLSWRLIVMLALNVVELGYHVVKYFVSLQTSVVITGEYNVMINSEMN